MTQPPYQKTSIVCCAIPEHLELKGKFQARLNDKDQEYVYVENLALQDLFVTAVGPCGNLEEQPPAISQVPAERNNEYDLAFQAL